MLRVLFLCTANSSRSQMAEGFARALKPETLEAFSAGTAPSGVNPLAVRVMGEVGVDISRQRSKGVEELAGQPFDFIVTLCGDARDTCPVIPGAGRRIHRGFPDPARAEGAEEARLEEFRRVRDAIRAFIEAMPQNLTQNHLPEGD